MKSRIENLEIEPCYHSPYKESAFRGYSLENRVRLNAKLNSMSPWFDLKTTTATTKRNKQKQKASFSI